MLLHYLGKCRNTKQHPFTPLTLPHSPHPFTLLSFYAQEAIEEINNNLNAVLLNCQTSTTRWLNLSVLLFATHTRASDELC